MQPKSSRRAAQPPRHTRALRPRRRLPKALCARSPRSAQQPRNKRKEKILPLPSVGDTRIHRTGVRSSRGLPKSCPARGLLVSPVSSRHSRGVSGLRGHLPPSPHPPHPHAVQTRMRLLHSPIVRSSKYLAPLANEYNRQKTGRQRQTDGNEKESVNRTQGGVRGGGSAGKDMRPAPWVRPLFGKRCLFPCYL